MKHLKKFATAQDYEAVKSNLPTPNVSLITDESVVEYIKGEPTPPTPVEHEYVDLGLPSGTLWAKCNVGAASETEYGNYYQYGKGVNDYSVTSGESYYDNVEDPLPASADTATQLWGNDWHMPTLLQFNELTANTTYTWENDFKGSGINGAKFTANNGNYVFFPAVGKWNPSDNTNPYIGVDGSYWTSSPDEPSWDTDAYCMYLSSTHKYTYGTTRTYGCSVRPVKDA